MKNNTKLALTAAAVIAATSAFASHVSQPLHHKLFSKTATSKPSGLIIGVDWMFLRPSDNASNYGTSFFTSSNVSQVKRIGSGLQGAFHLFTGYGNIQHGTSIQFGWTHLQTGRTEANHNGLQSTQGAPAGVVRGTMVGNSAYNYDALDLDLTKSMSPEDKLNWQLFTGIRFAEINHSLNSSVINTASYTNYKTDFRGIGPRFGITGNYELCHGVKLFGQMAVAFLYNNLKDKYSVGADQSPIGLANIRLHGKSVDRQYIIPNVDAQLGLSYDHPFHGAIIELRTGYQVDYYDNATTNLTAASNSSSQLEDVNFSGPFVGLVIHG